jgi:hypothetical protein
MDAVTWEKLKSLLTGVLQRSPPERESYLRDRCPDLALRSEIDTLLRAYDERPDLLDQPAALLHIATEICRARCPAARTMRGRDGRDPRSVRRRRRRVLRAHAPPRRRWWIRWRVIEDRRSATANVRTQAIECNREFRRKVH